MEKIIKVDEIHDIKIGNTPPMDGSVRAGVMHMMNHVFLGYSSYDGYFVETSEHKYFILIDNGQCCCESWGYFASNDDLDSFVGKILASVEMTDTALDTELVENSGYYGGDEGGIQFVNFRMASGEVLQFAVYNAHNGFYGHPIYFIKDDEIILDKYL